MSVNLTTKSLQALIGTKVEICGNGLLDGTRGVLKAYKIDKETVYADIEVKSLWQTVTGNIGDMFCIAIDDVIVLVDKQGIPISDLEIPEVALDDEWTCPCDVCTERGEDDENCESCVIFKECIAHPECEGCKYMEEREK